MYQSIIKSNKWVLFRLTNTHNFLYFTMVVLNKVFDVYLKTLDIFNKINQKRPAVYKIEGLILATPGHVDQI